MIVGHAGHGKDTFAGFLADTLGVTTVSSSKVALEVFLLDVLRDKGLGYASADAAYEDRINHRKLWFDEITAYNAGDPCRLMREVYARCPIYVGCRSRIELLAGREQGLFGLTLCVLNPRVPEEHPSSMQIPVFGADVTVFNDCGLWELREKAERFASLFT
jgi:hypothetical protein